MSGWSRRSVLAAIGLAPLAPACMPRQRASGVDAIPQSLAATRVRLRELVSSMQTRFPYAAAHAVVSRHDLVTADGAEDAAERSERVMVTFTAIDAAGLVRERATNDTSSDGLVRAAAELLGDRRGDADFGTPRDFPTIGARIDSEAASWLARAQEILDRARRHGGSRIVHRTGYVDARDTERVFVGDGRDWYQRTVQLRAGAVFVAAAGDATYTDVAERAGTIGVRAARVSDNQLARAADGALALLNARPAPSGEYDVVLDPSCGALLAAHCVAPALLPGAWRSGASAAVSLRGQRVAAEQLSVIDDPALPGGYGSFAFDERGHEAARGAPIERGLLTAPLAGPASNLSFAAGEHANSAALVGEVEAGMLLEGALAAAGDPTRWSAQLRIARGKEIKDGKLTGRLYGPLLLHGAVPQLLSAITGATQRLRWHATSSAAAAGSPFLKTRARVAGA